MAEKNTPKFVVDNAALKKAVNEHKAKANAPAPKAESKKAEGKKAE
jgi:hypothetical protein